MAELCQNISPGLLTDAASGVITRKQDPLQLQKKKGNMPFFIMLMPIKILIIWMFLQHLFGA